MSPEKKQTQPKKDRKQNSPDLRNKAFKFRIYPTEKQIGKLEWTLRCCKELYNAALQERRDAYKMCGVSVSYYTQNMQLPEIKEIREEYRDIHSQFLQDVLTRVDKTMDNFFRRVKNGEKPGYPRFKSGDRYDSFTYTQSGFEIIKGKLNLSKIGRVKIKLHREISGTCQTTLMEIS